MLDSLFKIFTQADRGFVVMRPRPDGPLVPVAVKTRRAGDEERMRISRTIVEEAMKSRKAILSADAASDERFGMAQSIADFSIRSMMCPDDGQRRPADRRHPDRYAQPAEPLHRFRSGSAGQRREPGGRVDRQRQDARAGHRSTGDAARPGAGPPDAAGVAAGEAAAGARLLLLRLLPGGPAKSAATTTTTFALSGGRLCGDRWRCRRQRCFGRPADGPAVGRRSVFARQRSRPGQSRANKSTTAFRTATGRTSSSPCSWPCSIRRPAS